MSLGTLLKSSRERLGMTLEEVGAAAGSSKSYIHALEKDQNEPGILLCCRLSVALGIPVQLMAAEALIHALRVHENQDE